MLVEVVSLLESSITNENRLKAHSEELESRIPSNALIKSGAPRLYLALSVIHAAASDKLLL
jgi:hypothetical protein